MKQNITSSQLNELSDKGKEKLKLYIFTKKESMVCSSKESLTNTHGDKPCKYCTLPLLSIGQMLEFLDDNSKFDIGDDWDNVVLPVEIGEMNKLADALWEACKNILDD